MFVFGFNVRIFLIFISLVCLSEGLIELLESRRGQDSVYIGCMKSGEVVADE